MKKIALVYNSEKEDAVRTMRTLFECAHEYDVDFYTVEGKDSTELQQDTDFIVVLGGDGTFLRAARMTFGKKIPLYAVNLGRLGFLATGDVATLKQDIQNIIQGRYSLTEREVIKGTVWRDGIAVQTLHALNDLVISKTHVSRMTDLQVNVNGKLLSVFRADGIILSTPTGSTAYSLSAGGPIIPPEVSCLLLVPICAHTLFARPVVLNSKDKTVVKIIGNNTDLCLTQDGQLGYELQANDLIEAEIETAFKVYTIETEGGNYYDTLRRKLSWGFNGAKGELQGD